MTHALAVGSKRRVRSFVRWRYHSHPIRTCSTAARNRLTQCFRAVSLRRPKRDIKTAYIYIYIYVCEGMYVGAVWQVGRGSRCKSIECLSAQDVHIRAVNMCDEGRKVTCCGVGRPPRFAAAHPPASDPSRAHPSSTVFDLAVPAVHTRLSWIRRKSMRT